MEAEKLRFFKAVGFDVVLEKSNPEFTLPETDMDNFLASEETELDVVVDDDGYGFTPSPQPTHTPDDLAKVQTDLLGEMFSSLTCGLVEVLTDTDFLF